MFDLTVARYRVAFQAETVVRFPAYAGSTWRGAFGHALRRAVCVTRAPTCTDCLLRRACVYSYVFETPAGQQPLLEKIDSAPHPFILHPLATSGAQYARGETLYLGLSLFGRAIAHLPYVIHALQQAGAHGIGQADGRLRLLAVEQEACTGQGVWQTIYQAGAALQALPVLMPGLPPVPEQVVVRWQTPYRAVQQGRLLRAGQFGFAVFFTQLMRRISLLQALHGAEPLTLDFKTLSQQASQVQAQNSQLHWYDWARYSNRQQSLVQMGGLLGEFTLEAEQLAVFWPWLWLGQWTHVGKGAVMGLGEYSLDVAEKTA